MFLEGEQFYLYAILNHHPVQSLNDCQNVNGTSHATYQEAVTELELFASDHKAEYTMMKDIADLQTLRSPHGLYVHIVVNNCVPNLWALWNLFHEQLAYNYTLQANGIASIGEVHPLLLLQRTWKVF